MANMGGKQVTKHRKDLVADLGEKNYADVVEIAVTKMQNGLHFDLFPSLVSWWPCKSFLCLGSSPGDLQGLVPIGGTYKPLALLEVLESLVILQHKEWR